MRYMVHISEIEDGWFRAVIRSGTAHGYYEGQCPLALAAWAYRTLLGA